MKLSNNKLSSKGFFFTIVLSSKEVIKQGIYQNTQGILFVTMVTNPPIAPCSPPLFFAVVRLRGRYETRLPHTEKLNRRRAGRPGTAWRLSAGKASPALRGVENDGQVDRTEHIVVSITCVCTRM